MRKLKKLAQFLCGKSRNPNYYLGYAFGYKIAFWVLFGAILILFNLGVCKFA
jgi:cytochrome b subunit of formate dehydrogenase